MPKSPKQRIDAFRENLKALGRKRWEVAVTAEEKEKLKSLLDEMRKPKNKRG